MKSKTHTKFLIRSRLDRNFRKVRRFRSGEPNKSPKGPRHDENNREYSEPMVFFKIEHCISLLHQ